MPTGVFPHKPLSDEHKRKISRALMGRSYVGGFLGKKHSAETKRKMSSGNKGKFVSKETKEKMSVAHKGLFVGKNNPNWHGGASTPGKLRMLTQEYKEWRITIYKRDNFTCQWCGNKRSNNFEVHHILPWVNYPEYRYCIDNGVTLCLRCHNGTKKRLNH